MDYTILIVDDELEMCLSLSEILNSEGFSTLYTTSPLESLHILREKKIKLIIMDVRMPDMGGMDLLKAIKKQDSSIVVIMITGYPTVENAVRAMKYGAVNFYVKPLKLAELLKEIHELADKSACKSLFQDGLTHTIVTEDSAMQKILKNVEKASPTTAPVLLTGESGTGKERVANLICHLSSRTSKPFIKVNCAALPDNLLESELFGHEKGAFTGAIKGRKGRFELADTGTIFLDEIGNMSLNMQAKLLRVLQEQEFERVGGTKVITTDVRVIAATNKDLKTLIASATFREDLFYRLSVITIHLPPLRKRRGDILLLAKHFIEQYNTLYHTHIKGLSEEVQWFFLSHKWPGNVRELKNCVERGVIFCEQDLIKIGDLGAQYAELIESQATTGYEEVVESLNREIILDALNKSGGVKKKAADLLNITRRTLYNRMKKLGLQ